MEKGGNQLNEYGNRFGYHSPESGEVFYRKILSGTSHLDGDWTDSSWHNDACDSITYTVCFDKGRWEGISVYFPKTSINTFCVCDDNQDTLLCTESVDEVISFVGVYIIDRWKKK